MLTLLAAAADDDACQTDTSPTPTALTTTLLRCECSWPPMLATPSRAVAAATPSSAAPAADKPPNAVTCDQCRARKVSGAALAGGALSQTTACYSGNVMP